MQRRNENLYLSNNPQKMKRKGRPLLKKKKRKEKKRKGGQKRWRRSQVTCVGEGRRGGKKFITLPTAPSSSAGIRVPEEPKEKEKTRDDHEQDSAELPPMEEPSISAIEAIIGYKFWHPELLVEAMTHVSFYIPMKPKKNYERLEFVGDAVLNVGIATDVFFNYEDLAPGTMTRLRAANVDKEKLSRVAVVHGLHQYLRHKSPQLESKINEYVEDMKNYPVHSNGLLDAPKALADIIESILGAVFVDTNKSYDTVWKIFTRLAQPFITIETLGKHPVTELNELCQKLHQELKFNEKNWPQNLTIDVLVNGKVIGSATYGPKKEVCRNRAAHAALDRLKELLRSNELETALIA